MQMKALKTATWSLERNTGALTEEEARLAASQVPNLIGKDFQFDTFWHCSLLRECFAITNKTCCVVNFIARKIQNFKNQYEIVFSYHLYLYQKAAGFR